MADQYQEIHARDADRHRRMVELRAQQQRRNALVGHYAGMCKSKQNIEIIADASFELDDFRGYLCLGVKSIGTVTGAWMTNTKVNGRELRFKIDTGADVTVIPEKVYKQPSATLNFKLLPDIHYVAQEDMH